MELIKPAKAPANTPSKKPASDSNIIVFQKKVVSALVKSRIRVDTRNFTLFAAAEVLNIFYDFMMWSPVGGP
jgi:hypothetical protein